MNLNSLVVRNMAKPFSKGGSHYLAPLDTGHLEKWTYFARSYLWNLEIQIFVQYCSFSILDQIFLKFCDTN